MQLRKRLDDIPVATRIIISGTPIQNNLMEMHTLFDFACPVGGQAGPGKGCQQHRGVSLHTKTILGRVARPSILQHWGVI